MDFSDALDLLKTGAEMTRTGWNGKGLFVKAQFPDNHAKIGAYLFLDATALGGARVPWVPGQADIFAEDWHILKQ